MPFRFAGYIRPLFLTGDILLLNASFILAYFLKFDNLSRVFEHPYSTLIIVANLVWLLIAFATRSYSFSRVTPLAKIIRGLAVYILLHMLIISAFWVYEKAYYYSREYLVYSYIVLTLLLFAWRAGGILLLRIYRRRGYNFRKIVIFGYGEVAEELRKYFLYIRNQDTGLSVISAIKKKGKKFLGIMKV